MPEFNLLMMMLLLTIIIFSFMFHITFIVRQTDLTGNYPFMPVVCLNGTFNHLGPKKKLKHDHYNE